jgi:hypothetical protein
MSVAAARVGKVSNLTRAARQEMNDQRLHIQIRNIPRTAVPADIRRAVTRNKLTGVSDVHIDYTRFLSAGRAYLTLTQSEFIRDNLASLQKANIGGLQVDAFPSPPPLDVIPTRSRGARGRSDAAGRGAIVGNGPSAGLLNPNIHVVIWGLPGKITPNRLKEYLSDFQLAGTNRGEIAQVNKPEERFSLFSRHIVRMSSVSEAHRLVRQLHMTYFEPEKSGEKYPVRARVIY